jgi:hypothetical protein
VIRAARFGDIPAIASVLHEAGARSSYAGRATWDEKECRRLLTQAIQRNGVKTEGGTLCLVSEGRAGVDGVLIMVLQRLYLIAPELRAMELFYVVSPGASGRAGVQMLVKALRWLATVPGCIEVALTPNSVVGDPARVGRMLERKGFAPVGTMYRKEIGP